MLDERTGKALQTRDERKNVIASVAKQSLIVLFVAIFFSACTDYVAQIEDKIEESERILTGFVNDSRDGQTYKTVKITIIRQIVPSTVAFTRGRRQARLVPRAGICRARPNWKL